MKKKLKVHQARHTAIGTGKAAAAIVNLQMDKAPAETGNAVTVIGDMIHTEKIGAQSDPPVGKHRIPDDYVGFILAMEREEPIRPEEYDPYLLCSPEEARRKYEEEAFLFKRINDDFEPFQAMVRKEWDEKGYVEIDHDFVSGLDKVKDVHKEDWDEWRKHQESLKYIQYVDSDDEAYADFEELLEQFNLGEANKKPRR
jgi:hypothetical protein